MQYAIITKIVFIAAIIFTNICWAQGANTLLSQSNPTNPQPTETPQENLNALIQVLENPKTRDDFIQQLKGLASAQTTSETALIKQEGTILLHNVADSLESLAHQFDEMTNDIRNIPDMFHWLVKEMKDPLRRSFWEEISWNLLRIVGTAYALLHLCRWLFGPARQKITSATPTHKSLRTGNILMLGILELLPLFLFVMTAYFLTALFDPDRMIKLLVASWINAIVIVNVLQAIIRFMINLDYTHYNLLHLDENTIDACRRKIKNFLNIAIYGYFILQSALIIELPQFIFEIFTLFFSTIVAGTLIFWSFYHREIVAAIIRGNPEKIHLAWLINIRNTIANIWPWITLAYITTIFLIVTLEIHHGVMFIINATVLSLLILTASFIALNTLEWFTSYLVKLQKNRIAIAPGFETQVKNYFVLIKKVIRGIIYLITLFGLFYAWNIHVLNWLWFGKGHALSEIVLRVFGIIAITFLVWVFCVSVIEYYLSLHMSKEQKSRAPRARSKTLLSVSRHFLAIILVVISGMLVISELGVNIGPLLAGAGVLGLAVGFGSQRLVQDIINGIFILLDDTISVDDVIVTAGKRGVVEAISIRTMRLRDTNGDTHTIPFSSVDTITNQTKHYSYAMFNIKVGHQDNVDDVLEAIKAASKTLRENPEFDAWVWDDVDIFGVEVFTEYGMDVKGRIKTAPGKQNEVLCEFNRLVKTELDKRGVSWPYQQQAVLGLRTPPQQGAAGQGNNPTPDVI